MIRMTFIFAAFTIAFFDASDGAAATIPFVEAFDTGVSGWVDSINNPLIHVSSGGADGDGYATTTFNYFGYSSPFGGGPVTFRGSFADNASGGAFVGNYLTEGVAAISVQFRHDAPEPINLFMRVASRFNFPGAVIAQPAAIASGVWTEVVFEIDPESSFCIGEGVPCASALALVENLQFGTDAPVGLVERDFAYSLDIDQIRIVPIPEPGTASLLLLGVAALAATRKDGSA